MRTYGQYCPIARGAEVFAERWTPMIIRNLHLGCGNFGEILDGAPGLAGTVLSRRLKQLGRHGVVESAPEGDGRGHRYELDDCGPRARRSVQVARRVGRALDRDRPREPRSLCGPVVDVQRAPPRPAPGSTRRHPLRLHRLRRERYWLLIELGDTEICKTYPGLDEDLYITAEAEAFVNYAGQLSWTQAIGEGRIQLDGLPSLIRAFPTWNARSMFARIRPVSRTATSPAG